MAEKRNSNFNYPVSVEHRESPRATLPSLRPKAGGPSGFTRSEIDYWEQKEKRKPFKQDGFLHSCLQQKIKVLFLDGREPLECELSWYDQYSLGVTVDTKELLIYKQSITSIEKIER